MKSWLTALYNDLQLWNDLNDFTNVVPEIADAAITVMQRHFWYLTEECVPFVLFSDQISAAEKKKNFTTNAQSQKYKSLRYGSLYFSCIEQIF